MQNPNESYDYSVPKLLPNSDNLPSTSFHEPKNNVELQKLLIDERIRCETHKTNYQTLKEEHKRLQDEFVKLQNDVARVHDKKVDSSEQLQGLVHNLQAALASKSRELEEVRGQTLHPHKLEIIKAEITKELEEPLKGHMLAMDKEIEKYRKEYNSIRYEYTFLKSEYDHAKAEHSRNIEELRLRFQAQLSALEQERDNLLNTQKSTTDVDAQKLLQLQRQKTQLEQRVKNLLDEITELQRQKEKIAIEADSVQRTQAKEMTQMRANIQTIESDKRSSDFQCERLQKELREANDQYSRLNQQIQNLNRECAALKSTADEESHRHKVALTNHKLEALKLKGDLERERDSLVTKTNNLEAEIDLLRASADTHEQAIEDLEREASRRVQEAREEEWSKNNALQHEKIQMEEKCRELELRLDAEKSSRVSERDESEEKFRLFELREVATSGEISQLKKQLEMEIRAKAKLEKASEDVASLRQCLLERDHELQTMTSLRQQALAEVANLKEILRDVRSDAESAKTNAHRLQVEAERSIENYKLEVLEEKHRQQSRLDQMEHRVKQSSDNHERALRQHKRVKQLLISKLKHMKKKLELLQAEKEKMEIELKAGSYGVSMEEHNKLRHHLREMKRRHHEFRQVIGLGEQLTFHSSNDATMIDVLGISRLTNISNGNNHQESLDRKEVSLVLKRLDEIAEKQKEQMEALDAVAMPKKKENLTTGARDFHAPFQSKHVSINSESSASSAPETSPRVPDEPALEKNAPDGAPSDYEDDFDSTGSTVSRD